MKLRHAAALALVGWYLMVPPLDSHDRTKPDPYAPLSDWSIDEGFDTASACETAKYEMRGRGEKNPDRLTKLTEILCLCVATDDPRLKPN